MSGEKDYASRFFKYDNGRRPVRSEQSAASLLKGAITLLTDDPMDGIQLVSRPEAWLEFKKVFIMDKSPEFAELVERFLSALGCDDLSVGFLREVVDDFLRRLTQQPYILRQLADWVQTGHLSPKVATWLVWMVVRDQTGKASASAADLRADSGIKSIVSAVITRVQAGEGGRNLVDQLRPYFPEECAPFDEQEEGGVGGKLKSMSTAAAAAAASDLSLQSLDQGPFTRHDNDHPSIADVAVLPTKQEVDSTQRPFLPPARPELLADGSDLIDRNFRWLREDMVASIRESVQLLTPGSQLAKTQPKLARRLRYRTVAGAQFREPKWDHSVGFGVVVTFVQPAKSAIEESRKRAVVRANECFEREKAKLKKAIDEAKMNNEPKEKLQSKLKDLKKPPVERVGAWFMNWWKTNNRMLARDDLVCFIDPRSNEFLQLAVVADGNQKDKGLSVDDNGICSIVVKIPHDSSDMAAFFTQIRVGKFPTVNMVSLPISYFAYEPVLRRLKAMAVVPLENHVVRPNLDADCALDYIGDPLRDALAQIRERGDHGECIADLFGPAAKRPLVLDGAQTRSVADSFDRLVALVQGPPGTGKSFCGAMIGKLIVQHTQATVLVVCYTNHALDEFLLDLVKFGIDASQVIRLGNSPKMHPTVQKMKLQRDAGKNSQSDVTRRLIGRLHSELTDLDKYLASNWSELNISQWENAERLLMAVDPDALDAFRWDRKQQDQFNRVGKSGKVVNSVVLWRSWLKNRPLPAGVDDLIEDSSLLWSMSAEKRKVKRQEWLQTSVEKFLSLAEQYERKVGTLSARHLEDDGRQLVNKRIIGCTTTAAAKYADLLDGVRADVLLVEEAGEIMESHILTSLSARTQHLIMIGDHKQLRPKIERYELGIEAKRGVALNVSMFERLVAAGAPLATLEEQHRMRPELAEFARCITYPDLRSSVASTADRPDIVGVGWSGKPANMLWLNHQVKETGGAGGDGDAIPVGQVSLSKKNSHEAQWVRAIVGHLLLQGVYSANNIVVLTPYLGQLMELRSALQANKYSVALASADKRDLRAAGIDDKDMDDEAKQKKNKQSVRVATVDNFQGEEADIVVVSMVRSNAANEIGFMSSKQRVNVLLSRARNSLIVVGNRHCFEHSAKDGGGPLWRQVLDIFEEHGRVVDAFPAYCARHKCTESIEQPAEFASKAPDGGCSLVCGRQLKSCSHCCGRSCHGHLDCAKLDQCMQCLEEQKQRIALHKKIADEKRRQMEFERLEAQKQLDLAAVEQEMENLKLEEDRRVRLKALELEEEMRKKELSIRREHKGDRVDQKVKNMKKNIAKRLRRFERQIAEEQADDERDGHGDEATNSPADHDAALPSDDEQNESIDPIEYEWNLLKLDLTQQQRKPFEELLNLVGLRAVKEKALTIYRECLADQRLRDGGNDQAVAPVTLNFAFVGNPGCGKTVVARLFARILRQAGARSSDKFVQKTANEAIRQGEAKFCTELKQLVGDADAKNAPDGKRPRLLVNTDVEVQDTVDGNKYFPATIRAFDKQSNQYSVEYVDKKKEDDVVRTRIRVPEPQGGVFFIDEAYDLNPAGSTVGKAILGEIMQASEEHRDKLTFILAGYKADIQDKLFKYNDGMPSRFEVLDFEDFTEPQLQGIWEGLARERKVPCAPKVAAVAASRLGAGIGRKGFGNARDVRKLFEQSLSRAKGTVLQGKPLRLTVEHVIGPPPSRDRNPRLFDAKDRLDAMIGLETVKTDIDQLINLAATNYQRQRDGKKGDAVSLNRLFVGSPGTGKTTVAKLYGEILKGLGFLSSGDVVFKVASDFVGQYVGESQKKTGAILKEAEGKVLLIDEAYGLDDNLYGKQVLDTLVEKVSGSISGDMAVVMCGYQEQMRKMLRDQNPGLKRRFPVEVQFPDFTDEQLRAVWTKLSSGSDVTIADDVVDEAIRYLSQKRNTGQFGNAGDVNTLFAEAKRKMSARTGGRSRVMLIEDILAEGTLRNRANPLAALDYLQDSPVKTRLEQLCQRIAVRKQEGRSTDGVSGNFVFLGNAGTGKTVTARKLGTVFAGLGLLGREDVVETTGPNLVGQYVGHSKKNMEDKMHEAAGGVLFIDEAYELDEECMTVLLAMCTQERFVGGKTIIVLAGYEQEMHQFFKRNQGLRSRFTNEILFPDWAPEQCVSLMRSEARKSDLCNWEPGVELAIKDCVTKLAGCPGWGNARSAKDLWTAIEGKRDERVFSCPEPPTKQITLADAQQAIDEKCRSASSTSLASHALQQLPRNQKSAKTPARKQQQQQQQDHHQQQNEEEEEVETEENEEKIEEEEEKIEEDVEMEELDEMNFNVWSRECEQHWKQNWHRMDANHRAAAEEQRQRLREEAEELKRLERERLAEEERLRKELEELERQRRLAAEEAERRRLAEIERRKREEMERLKRDAEEARKAQEKKEKISRALMTIGKCPAGFCWRREGNGFRCGGGSHFASFSQVAKQAGVSERDVKNSHF